MTEKFPPIGDIDPSMPHFRFSGEEKEAMHLQGMTDEEIDQKEVEAMNKIGTDQVEGELTNI